MGVLGDGEADLLFCGDGFTGVCVSRPVQLHALEAHSLLCVSFL